MNSVKSPWFLLLINLTTGIYFTLLVFGARLNDLPQWLRALGELLTIPFLLTLLAGTFLALRNFVMPGSGPRWVAMAAMAAGFSAIILLVIQTFFR